MFSQCDHNRGSAGQFGGSPIRKKKEQRKEGGMGWGGGLKLLFLMEKVCKTSNFHVWESNEKL